MMSFRFQIQEGTFIGKIHVITTLF